uniref:Uncharacterized protein n=1 Tax=Arundo donax TaxID=35708 RepID=A0A0A9ADF5_ARUDO
MASHETNTDHTVLWWVYKCMNQFSFHRDGFTCKCISMSLLARLETKQAVHSLLPVQTSNHLANLSTWRHLVLLPPLG